MAANENQIVVYQPNETVRLDVRLENETVWLTQSQMATLFGCSTDNIGLHLKNVYAVGELSREATTEDFSVVRKEGARQVRRNVTCYNLDAIISVGYRVNSILGVKFRQWATTILKEYLLKGYSFNARMNQLEDKVDRRLAQHDQAIVDLKAKVDFFVQTKEHCDVYLNEKVVVHTVIFHRIDFATEERNRHHETKRCNLYSDESSVSPICQDRVCAGFGETAKAAES